MKKYQPIIDTCTWMFILSVILTSCTPPEKLLKPTGDTASIVLQNNLSLEGELLTLVDSTLYVKTDFDSDQLNFSNSDEIVSLHISEIQSVKVSGYSNKKWIIPVIALEFIPAILLGIAASSEEVDENFGEVFLTFSLIPITNALFFAFKTPKTPQFKHPFSAKNLFELKKYTRFPQGLTPAQLDELLGINRQSEINRLH